PLPSVSMVANALVELSSRIRPLEPTQIAPEDSTNGSSAAAKPPVIGSLVLARATRFETTTRFTGGHLTDSDGRINRRLSIWFRSHVLLHVLPHDAPFAAAF